MRRRLAVAAAGATFALCATTPRDAGAQSAGASVGSAVAGFVTQIAAALGGRCWPVASVEVQLLRRPMCLRNSGASDAIEQGRQQRVAALKAMGLTLTMLTRRTSAQRVHVAQRQSLEGLVTSINAGIGVPVLNPARDLTAVTTVAPTASRTSYRLTSDAVALYTALHAPVGMTTVGVYDPFATALAARSSVLANTLARTASTVGTQAQARAGVVASGRAVGAEAARLDAEGQAMQSYLDAVGGLARAQHLQLRSYQALRRELTEQLDQLRVTPGFQASW